jgi:hypothetical protein
LLTAPRRYRGPGEWSFFCPRVPNLQFDANAVEVSDEKLPVRADGRTLAEVEAVLKQAHGHAVLDDRGVRRHEDDAWIYGKR